MIELDIRADFGRLFFAFCSDPLEEGITIYSNGFFCSVNFDRSIYSSLRVVSGIIKKPVQPRIWN